jgi:hypothetical protein
METSRKGLTLALATAAVSLRRRIRKQTAGLESLKIDPEVEENDAITSPCYCFFHFRPCRLQCYTDRRIDA